MPSRDGVSNHQPHGCLLNRLFGRRSKENIKAPRHWPLCGEFNGDWWIRRTYGQLRRKYFHLMTSSWSQTGSKQNTFKIKKNMCCMGIIFKKMVIADSSCFLCHLEWYHFYLGLARDVIYYRSHRRWSLSTRYTWYQTLEWRSFSKNLIDEYSCPTHVKHDWIMTICHCHIM